MQNDENKRVKLNENIKASLTGGQNNNESLEIQNIIKDEKAVDNKIDVHLNKEKGETKSTAGIKATNIFSLKDEYKEEKQQ